MKTTYEIDNQAEREWYYRHVLEKMKEEGAEEISNAIIDDENKIVHTIIMRQNGRDCVFKETKCKDKVLIIDEKTIKVAKKALKHGFWFKEEGTYCSWKDDRLFIDDAPNIIYYGSAYEGDGYRMEYMPLNDKELVEFYYMLKERKAFD